MLMEMTSTPTEGEDTNMLTTIPKKDNRKPPPPNLDSGTNLISPPAPTQHEDIIESPPYVPKQLQFAPTPIFAPAPETDVYAAMTQVDTQFQEAINDLGK
jgi:hypothetical protein